MKYNMRATKTTCINLVDELREQLDTIKNENNWSLSLTIHLLVEKGIRVYNEEKHNV